MMTDRAAVLSALAELEDSEGRLTPEAVVKAARKPESPLHSHFEWDNGKAAFNYRIVQARTLIRSVWIPYKVERREVSAVAYVRDPTADPNERRYVSLEAVKEREDESRAIIVREYTNAIGHVTRARNIAAALAIDTKGAEEVIKRLNKLLSEIAHTSSASSETAH